MNASAANLPFDASLSWQRDFFAAAPPLPHSLLLCAPPGMGVEFLARALARRDLNSGGLDSDSDSENLDSENSDSNSGAPLPLENNPDFLPVIAGGAGGGDDAKKKADIIGVDEVRRLADFCALHPSVSSCRAAALFDAHKMNTAAANALLKTLEEPRPGKKIILTAPGAAWLPPTIVSRCNIAHAPLPSKADALAWLKQHAPDEDNEELLAYAGGAPLAALRLAENSSENEARRAFAQHLTKGARLDILAATALAEKMPPPVWLECAQKWVADLCRQKAGLPPRYFPAQPPPHRRQKKGEPAAFVWHNLQRELCAMKRAARQPLNPYLLAQKFLLDYRDVCRAQV